MRDTVASQYSPQCPTRWDLSPDQGRAGQSGAGAAQGSPVFHESADSYGIVSDSSPDLISRRPLPVHHEHLRRHHPSCLSSPPDPNEKQRPLRRRDSAAHTRIRLTLSEPAEQARNKENNTTNIPRETGGKARQLGEETARHCATSRYNTPRRLATKTQPKSGYGAQSTNTDTVTEPDKTPRRGRPATPLAL